MHSKYVVLKWFALSFILATILFMLIPIVGSAQERSPNPDANQDGYAQSPQEPQVPASDLPLSRGPYIAANDQPHSNLEEFQSHQLESQFPAESVAVSEPTNMSVTNPLVIPAADFRSDGTKPDSIFFTFLGGYMEGNSQNYGCVMAPAYLPNGAEVYEVWASARDNSASYNLYINLFRIDNSSGTVNLMASLETTGESANIQFPADLTVDYSSVSYPSYSYYVTTCLSDSSQELYSVRIWFNEP